MGKYLTDYRTLRYRRQVAAKNSNSTYGEVFVCLLVDGSECFHQNSNSIYGEVVVCLLVDGSECFLQNFVFLTRLYHVTPETARVFARTRMTTLHLT